MKAKILLVDDHATTRESLARLMRMNGWQVDLAADGKQAWLSLRDAMPDVLVTDYLMPGLTGAQLIERLKAEAVTPMPKTVLMSAFDLPRRIRELADVFLPKPVALETLDENLRTLLKLPKD